MGKRKGGKKSKDEGARRSRSKSKSESKSEDIAKKPELNKEEKCDKKGGELLNSFLFQLIHKACFNFFLKKLIFNWPVKMTCSFLHDICLFAVSKHIYSYD